MREVLGDLGEREIIRRILPRFSEGIGNDCGVVDVPAGQLIATTDPVPEPAAKVIGLDPDLYWMGWLLVVINASDLAAAGARPVAFLAAIETPSSLEVAEFERLLLGIKEGCSQEGLAYIGGNLREAQKIGAVGVAFGRTEGGRVLRRTGAREGDVVISVGSGGRFWRDALLIRNGSNLRDRQSSPVFRPRSQLQAMRALNEGGAVVAAMDNSDGLLPTLQQLAEANGLVIEVDLQALPSPEGASMLSVDPVRLWLGWGDWNVVAVVRAEEVDRAARIAQGVGSIAVPIGRFVGGEPRVLLRRGTVLKAAPRLESERFAMDSWFSNGIDGYVENLLRAELP